jgi:hypothetical protein
MYITLLISAQRQNRILKYYYDDDNDEDEDDDDNVDGDDCIIMNANEPQISMGFLHAKTLFYLIRLRLNYILVPGGNTKKNYIFFLQTVLFFIMYHV